MLKEFKEFIMRGSVVELAVGVVIGAAFGRVVASFVSDLLMPPIGMLLGKVNKLFSDTPQRIELERMFARTRFEKLIETLLEINRRSARHVIEVVALPIPGQ